MSTMHVKMYLCIRSKALSRWMVKEISHEELQFELLCANLFFHRAQELEDLNLRFIGMGLFLIKLRLYCTWGLPSSALLHCEPFRIQGIPWGRNYRPLQCSHRTGP
jgi:uncharacterized membrane protein